MNYTRAAVAAGMGAIGAGLCLLAVFVGLGVTFQAVFGDISTTLFLLTILTVSPAIAIGGGAIMARTLTRKWWKAFVVSVVAHILGAIGYVIVVRYFGISPPESSNPDLTFVAFIFALLYIFVAPIVVVFSIFVEHPSADARRKALLPVVVALVLIGAVVISSWNAGVLIVAMILSFTLLPALAAARE